MLQNLDMLHSGGFHLKTIQEIVSIRLFSESTFFIRSEGQHGNGWNILLL